MATMRAILQREFGGPDVLQLADVPRPRPGSGEILVDVRRAGINFADTHQRENTYLAPATLPLIPGIEVAGVRGDSGQRIVAFCGSGGYAEQVVVPETLGFPIPDGLDDGTALALMVNGLTAWHALRSSAQLRPGETVVVQAAAGGVGTMAIQLARHMDAGRVIAIASTERKRGLALELGADAAIGAEPDAMAERILDANDGRGVDVVLEMAGGQVLVESLNALAPFGRVVAYGAASGESRRISAARLMSGSRGVLGLWLGHLLGEPEQLRAPLEELFALSADGRLRAVVGGTYPLAEAARAHRDLQSRATVGKLLLDPSAAAAGGQGGRHEPGRQGRRRDRRGERHRARAGAAAGRRGRARRGRRRPDTVGRSMTSWVR